MKPTTIFSSGMWVAALLWTAALAFGLSENSRITSATSQLTENILQSTKSKQNKFVTYRDDANHATVQVDLSWEGVNLKITRDNIPWVITVKNGKLTEKTIGISEFLQKIAQNLKEGNLRIIKNW